MNSHSIEKLRKKFIWVATGSFLLVMFLIAGFIYATNLLVTRGEARAMLNYIISNGGEFPFPQQGESKALTEVILPETGIEPVTENNDYRDLSLPDMFGRRRSRFNSPDLFYSTRYFSVLFDSNLQVTEIKASHIEAISDEDAEKYARKALDNFFTFGSYGVFYYKVADLDDGGRIVVFLDSTSQVTTSWRIFVTSLVLIGLGMIISFFLIRVFSYQIVRKEIDNLERQKQFITNASHELKTPLAVIRANTEVEQMINGETEWNVSTMKQVERMTGLISNLVMIAKAEEKDDKIIRDMIDISQAVRETVQAFGTVASSDGKNLEMKIADHVRILANEGEIRQLVSLLTDNAIKYCDEGGTVTVALSQIRGKGARLLVSNSYAEGAGVDYSRFFDRFYRKDEAHSVEKEGFGIGLSIAEKLVEEYHGSIDAGWKDGVITFTCILRKI